MSENKYFIFKTALPNPTYIGYDFKPDENSVAYGIKFTTIPEGNILYNGLDKNDCKLLIIENPKANIKTLKEFDNNYKPFTTGIKLKMTSDAFSECVGDAIKASHSGKPSPAKASVKKASGKKTSVKKTKGGKHSKKRSMKGGKKSNIKSSISNTGSHLNNDLDDYLDDINVSGGNCKKGGKKKSKKKSSKKGGCGCAMALGGKKGSKKGSKKRSKKGSRK